MNNSETTHQIGKWKIVTSPFTTKEGKEVFVVKVYNTNSREYNSLKHYLSFRTEKERNDWVIDFVNRQKEIEAFQLKRREERKVQRKAEGSITTIVKRALAEKYGFKNVRVNRGSGTAYGWIEAYVLIDKPEDCTGDNPYCPTCGKAIGKNSDEARELVYAAMKKAGKTFGYYYSDDGYNTKSDEFLLQVRFNK